MKIALTGATGFLGAQVLARLLDAKHDVAALTRKPRRPQARVTWIGGSLEDDGALARLCDNVDAIVHLAGVVNAPDAAGFDAGNRTGTLAMIHAAEVADVARFVHISSLAAREPALSMYGASKRAGEDAVTTSALDWRVLRPPGIYGPGDTEMLDLFRAAARTGIVPLPPNGRVSVAHVDDMARLIVAMTESEGSHGLYEADDGRVGGWTHAELARAIGQAVGRKRVWPVSLPTAIVRAGATLDGLVRGDGARLTHDRASYLSHRDWTVDAGRRPPLSLWEPAIDTRLGLTETGNWYRAQGWL